VNGLNRLLLSGTLGFGAVGGGIFVGNALLLEKKPSIASAEVCLESIGENEFGATVSQEDLSSACTKVSELITSATVTIQSVTINGEFDIEETTEYILPESPSEFMDSARAYVENEDATDRKVAIVLTGVFAPLLTGLCYKELSRVQKRREARAGLSTNSHAETTA
jgi:hypothetical protein